jgi:hypothetical protein
MDECLVQVEAYLTNPNNTLPALNVKGLAELLQSEIVIDRGCYRLRWPTADWEPQPETEFEPDRLFLDQSQWEDSGNHLHEDSIWGLDDKVNTDAGIHRLALALIVADILRLKLTVEFPSVRFHITVSFYVKASELDDEETIKLSVMRSWRVSFHAVRRGSTLLPEDLNTYLCEAVGIMDIKPIGTPENPE